MKVNNINTKASIWQEKINDICPWISSVSKSEQFSEAKFDEKCEP